MTSFQCDKSLKQLGEALKLKHPELGVLEERISQLTSAYDFFQTLLTHLMPHIQNEQPFQRLTKLWEQQVQDYRARQKELRGRLI